MVQLLTDESNVENFGDASQTASSQTGSSQGVSDAVAAQSIDTFGNLMNTTLIIFIIIVIITYGLLIMAATKTKSEGLKIFLIVSMFMPFLTPIAIIIAIMILTNVI